MCGMPLPQRPLTAPGAHGTHTFTRFPLDRGNPECEDAGSAGGKANVPAESAGRPLPETPGAVPRSTEAQQFGEPAKSAEMVPEIPLDEYIRSFRYVPPADPAEVTMRGDAEILGPKVPAEAGPPATVTTEATTAAEANPDSATKELRLMAPGRVKTPAGEANLHSATEDVGQRLGLEEQEPGEERSDRRQFLDFSGPTSAAEKPEAPVPAVADTSFLDLDNTAAEAPEGPVAAAAEPSIIELRNALSGKKNSGKLSRRSAWTGVAVAALVGFILLGVLEWRSQPNPAKPGPVEVVKARFHDLWQSHASGPQSSGLASANPMLSAQHPNVANPKAPGPATAGTLAAAKPLDHAANPAPTSGPKAVMAAGPGQVAQGAASPQPATAEQNDTQVPARKPVRGEEELAKASNASDAAAAAAWLWKATAKGNPEAPVRLAEMYIRGDGVPRSCEQAVVLLETAATQANVRARSRLAALYNSGTCVPRDAAKAYRWANSALAADPSDPGARQNRDLIWRQMTPQERSEQPPP